MNKKLPSLIPILILTLVTVLMWVAFDVYQAFKKPVELTVSADISKPLRPILDQNVINQIESRSFLDDSQIPDNVIFGTPAPSTGTTTQPKPVATPTLQPTLKPTEATSSATTP